MSDVRGFAAAQAAYDAMEAPADSPWPDDYEIIDRLMSRAQSLMAVVGDDADALPRVSVELLHGAMLRHRHHVGDLRDTLCLLAGMIDRPTDERRMEAIDELGGRSGMERLL
jgi:hypothetical protein